jgi:DNA-binding winged helix-turn-helix (wHTH) protein/Tol biopolymer transport system component
MPLSTKEICQFGPYRLDVGGFTLKRGDEAVSLPPKLFELLAVLVLKGGDIVTKEELFQAVWPDAFVEESNLTQSIFSLRRRLGKTEAGDDYIQTVPRRGYRLNVRVTRVIPADRTFEDLPKSQLSPPIDAPTVVIAAENLQPVTRHSPMLLWLVPIFLILIAAVSTVVLLRLLPSHVEEVSYLELTRDGMDKRGSAHTMAGPTAALATDGARIYFTEGTTGGTKLAQVSVSGGETATIPLPFAMTQLLEYSAARSELLVGGNSGPYSLHHLWAVSLPGGTSHPIGDFEASDGAWSPDGSEIAFTSGTALYKSSSDGAQVRLIAKLPGIGWRPRWSPDARNLRLTILDKASKGASLWEVGADGSNLHLLLPGWNQPSSQCCGAWSKDGKRFIFQATHEGRTEIWAIPTSNRISHFLHLDAPQKITNSPDDLMSPIFSPDGASMYVLGQQLRGEVVRYSSKEREFLPYLGGKSLDFLEFSRDGTWITYVAYPEGTLWRSRPDGSDRLQLTFPPMRVQLPHWSPDDREIVFHGYGTDTPNRDYRISAMGGVPKAIFENEVMTLDWSPDGRSMLYSDFPFFETRPENTGVHILDIGSGHVSTLPESKGMVSPIWSPDGRYIAASKASGKKETMIFNVRTQSWSPLIESRGIPRWSHDSQWLFYFSAGAEPSIMKVQIGSGQIETVADLKSIRLAGELAGVQFSLSPDDSPILLRDTGTQEIYSVALHPK